jgi:hypothetical protein
MRGGATVWTETDPAVEIPAKYPDRVAGQEKCLFEMAIVALRIDENRRSARLLDAPHVAASGQNS